MARPAEKAILALAFVGVLLAAYGLWLHYAGDAGSICNLNETFSCDTVNKSAYATLFGVPVALLGLLAYAGLFLLVLLGRRVRRALAFTEKDHLQYLLGLAIVMLLFQGYLTFVEIAILHAYCLVCLGSQATILAIAILSWRRYRAA